MNLPVQVWPFPSRYRDLVLFSCNPSSDPPIGDVDEARRRFPNAIPVRHSEFAAGRACAEAALHALGGNGSVGIASDHRYPLFPASFTGSISHTTSEAIACVGRAAIYRSVGVDVEAIRSHEDLPAMASSIMTEREHDVFRSLGTSEALVYFYLCFSMKEAFFKAIFPVTHAWLEFKEVEVLHRLECDRVTIRPVGARSLALLKDGYPTICEAAVQYPKVVTMVAIER